MSRRGFVATAAAGAGCLLLRGDDVPRPNILWITCEDIGPQLGCYGDRYANTPNLDRLAARGVRYEYAWSNAPVCAPARTTIISGVYPTATGAEHMRSEASLPASMRMYPQFLRDAGYYATNNAKEDYNLAKPGRVWDDSSRKGHWRNRRPGQPFFSVFNLEITHESRVRQRPHTLVHDPAGVRVPAYHPDTLEVRHDWAQYYDNITTMDGQAGAILRQLEDDGLADNTIVFFYGDHGAGMPRSKRWPYNSGLRVPLIVHIPEKYRTLASPDYQPGGASRRMVGFIDLAPTLLSLAGVRPPEWMQGRAFLGPHRAPESDYLYGFRGRMDERYDMVRSVRDRRYIYIRNYMPHRIYGQHVAYMFETPTTQVWKQLYDEGKLKPPQTYFWETKPPEELYNLETDPDETRNLAASPEHRAVVTRMRTALRDWMKRTRDVGFLPEEEIHARSQDSSPYEIGHDTSRYPFDRILDTAERAAGFDSASVPELTKRLKDADSAVRYWAATGILARGQEAVGETAAALRTVLEDPAPSPRIPAAEALVRWGNADDRAKALDLLAGLANVDRNSIYVAVAALNAIDALGSLAAPVSEKVRALPLTNESVPQRMSGDYIKRLVEHITGA